MAEPIFGLNFKTKRFKVRRGKMKKGLISSSLHVFLPLGIFELFQTVVT